MTYSVSGIYYGYEVTVAWDADLRRLVGDDLVWNAVLARAREPLDLTPTGPTLWNPDPHLPSHALALLGDVIRVTSITGDYHEGLPEGMEDAERDCPPGTVF